jgi:hypothetical protein
MQPKTIADYGGPYRDALPVEDPETQLASDAFNALAEDTAQLTRTALRAIVRFATDAAPNLAVQGAVSVWGSTSAHRPTVTRNNVGVYSILYPLSFPDANGVEEEVSFLFAQASIDGVTPGHARILMIAANLVIIHVFDASWTLSDLGAGTPIVVWLR